MINGQEYEGQDVVVNQIAQSIWVKNDVAFEKKLQFKMKYNSEREWLTASGMSTFIVFNPYVDEEEIEVVEYVAPEDLTTRCIDIQKYENAQSTID